MNKPELVSAIAEKTGMTKKDSELAVNAFVDTVMEELANGGKVQLVGFGCFDVLNRKEREGRNPSTQQPMTIPAKKSPRFKPGQPLRDAVLV